MKVSNSNRLPIFTYVLVSLYACIFLLDLMIFNGELWEVGSGKSFDNMEFNNWYRLITGSFFHHSLLHLLGNSFALYFVGMILENKIGSWTFLFIYFLGNIGTSIIYSLFFSYTNGNGASPGIFALIACIVILFLKNRSFMNLRFGNWSVNYTFFYFVFGNFIGMDALIVHIIGFGIGSIITLLLYKQKTEGVCL